MIRKVTKVFMMTLLVQMFFAMSASAGFFSEIDILVREQALADLLPNISQEENFRLFSQIQISNSSKEIAECDWVVDGLIPQAAQEVHFVACVKLTKGNDIQVRILDSLFVSKP